MKILSIAPWLVLLLSGCQNGSTNSGHFSPASSSISNEYSDYANLNISILKNDAGSPYSLGLIFASETDGSGAEYSLGLDAGVNQTGKIESTLAH